MSRTDSICRVLTSRGSRIPRGAYLLAMGLLACGVVRAQDAEFDKVQPVAPVQRSILSKPLGIAREVKATGRDFVTFRDPKWSILTLAQIGAATADGVTSVEELHICPTCQEGGLSRLFVGQRPDAHKYVVAGILEIGIEAVTTHYFRKRAPSKKWYWQALWAGPQSLSLFMHARATHHNLALAPSV